MSIRSESQFLDPESRHEGRGIWCYFSPSVLTLQYLAALWHTVLTCRVIWRIWGVLAKVVGSCSTAKCLFPR